MYTTESRPNENRPLRYNQVRCRKSAPSQQFVESTAMLPARLGVSFSSFLPAAFRTHPLSPLPPIVRVADAVVALVCTRHFFPLLEARRCPLSTTCAVHFFFVLLRVDLYIYHGYVPGTTLGFASDPGWYIIPQLVTTTVSLAHIPIYTAYFSVRTCSSFFQRDIHSLFFLPRSRLHVHELM